MKDWQKLIFFTLGLILVPFMLFLAYGEILSIETISTHKVTGFSDAKLALIKPGMSAADAIAILGSPFYSNALGEGAKEWRYTQQKHGNECGFYHARWLVVSSNNVVVSVVKRRCPIQ